MSDSTTQAPVEVKPRSFVVNATSYVLILLGLAVIIWFSGALIGSSGRQLNLGFFPDAIALSMAVLGFIGLLQSRKEKLERAIVTTKGNVRVYKAINILAIVVGLGTSLTLSAIAAIS